MSASDEHKAEDTLAYRRLRAPQEPGGVLATPPVSTLLAPLGDPASRPLPPKTWQLAPSPAALSAQIRGEAWSAALEHAAAYRDAFPEFGLGGASAAPPENVPWIVSGHQPRLFHPGVWFKNFVLSKMASSCRGIALNLIVDNDLATDHGVATPHQQGGHWTRRIIAWNSRQAATPFEEQQTVVDPQMESFGERLAAAIEPLTPQPLIETMWPRVLERLQAGWPLGWCLAAARHGVEAEWGLRTLELPLSRLFDTSGTKQWVAAILSRIDDLHRCYNRSLLRFRNLHNIRSQSHPVPTLGADGSWLETPFWIWTRDDPQRRGLWMRRRNGNVELSDHRGWTAAGADAEQALAAARMTGKVRPRAIMTTLFARTMLADCFIHGIGGAKYDQLTDAIMADFLGLEPPAYLTTTATVPLVDRPMRQRRQGIRQLRRRVRDCTFNPQRFVSAAPAAQALVERKAALLRQPNSATRHAAIQKVNQRLQPWVAELREATIEQLERERLLLRDDAVLGSRETSFVLFDREKLPEKLLDLSQKVDKLSIN